MALPTGINFEDISASNLSWSNTLPVPPNNLPIPPITSPTAPVAALATVAAPNSANAAAIAVIPAAVANNLVPPISASLVIPSTTESMTPSIVLPICSITNAIPLSTVSTILVRASPKV